MAPPPPWGGTVGSVVQSNSRRESAGGHVTVAHLPTWRRAWTRSLGTRSLLLDRGQNRAVSLRWQQLVGRFSVSTRATDRLTARVIKWPPRWDVSAPVGADGQLAVSFGASMPVFVNNERTCGSYRNYRAAETVYTRDSQLRGFNVHRRQSNIWFHFWRL